MRYSVHTLNVGHGDSLIIELTDNQDVSWAVIDCHNPNHRQDSPTLKFLKSRNVQELEFICLTHPDRDHYSGIEQLIDHYSTGGRSFKKFYDSTTFYDLYEYAFDSDREYAELNKMYEALYLLLENNKIQISQTAPGLVLLQRGNISIMALGPDRSSVNAYVTQVGHRKKDPDSTAGVNKNLLCVMIAIDDTKHNSLLCSDAERQCIERVLNQWRKERRASRKKILFTFVKVAHHGSNKNNTNLIWKNSIDNPSFAAISAGPLYNLPNKEVVRNIIRSKTQLYCTNKGGCLVKSLPPAMRHRPIGLSPLLAMGINSISFEVLTVPPLHGNIEFLSENKPRIITEFPLPAITSIPLP